jgi:hypothetical protein
MKVIEKNENEAIIVYLENSTTYFKNLNLKTFEIKDIFKIQ